MLLECPGLYAQRKQFFPNVRCMILVCTVCLCPIKRVLGLDGSNTLLHTVSNAKNSGFQNECIKFPHDCQNASIKVLYDCQNASIKFLHDCKKMQASMFFMIVKCKHQLLECKHQSSFMIFKEDNSLNPKI